MAARLGSSVCTYDNNRQAAFRASRASLTLDADISTGSHRAYWYDPVELLNERRPAKQLRRKSREKCKRSTSQHERSTFTGEASTVAPERGKISRDGAASAASAAKMRGKRHKNAVARRAA